MKQFIKIVLALVAITLISSCATLGHRSSQPRHSGPTWLSSTSTENIQNSFVRIRTTMMMIKLSNCTDPQNLRTCMPQMVGSVSLSGTLIRTPQGNTGVLTAAHGIILDPRDFHDPDQLEGVVATATSFDLIRLNHPPLELAGSPKCNIGNDVCFLPVNVPRGTPVLSISSSAPTWGDMVWYAGNPLSVSSERGFPGTLPLFSGYFSGTPRNQSALGMYTLFAAPGSSGSPIVNSRGQVVGVVQAVHSRLPVISLSISHAALLVFLGNIDDINTKG